MTHTTHLGYGPFTLEDLLPGEEFARFDGTLAKVCEHQPYRTLNPAPRQLHLPDHVLVWVHWRTSNAATVLLHRTACAYALSPEQAQRIGARAKRRRDT